MFDGVRVWCLVVSVCVCGVGDCEFGCVGCVLGLGWLGVVFVC